MDARKGFGLYDLLVAACIFILGSIGLLAFAAETREDSRRVRCGNNLRQIGLAMKLYANENRGAYPRTIWDKVDPTPIWGSPYDDEGNPAPPDPMRAAPDERPNPFALDDKPNTQYRPRPNDVTAALYLLMRTQHITSEAFVCPFTRQERWDFGGGAHTAMSWTNWSGRQGIASHLSYSYCNPYPSESASKLLKGSTVVAETFAIAADMNPGGHALLEVTLQSKVEEKRRANSLNHQGDGQNVLYADAHVEFRPNPFAGPKGDNIYTFNGPEVAERVGPAGVVGPISDADDTVLLPTAHSLTSR
ncbi:MAG TPA: DUF1559 domain-containing protein [Tepidisphaeraceae bacterium]|nr:DUF1559 domain-containing protein [Tepidisphaeraceae bacterium]